MPKVFIEQATLSAIGDAIREKTGKTELIDPALMSAEIAGIETGGGGADLPEEAFTFSGACQYRFAYDTWNWFIENYGDKVITNDITNLNYMFGYSSDLVEIPFVLNISNATNFTNTFCECNKLKECPKIRGTIKYASSDRPSMDGLLQSCKNIRYLDDLFEPDMLNYFSQHVQKSSSSYCRTPTFLGCNSLRRVPAWWYKFRSNEESTTYPSGSNCLYNGAFSGAYAIDEVLDVPVWRCQGAQTSNMFANMFSSCYHLKDFTFETIDGELIVTQWKNQTITIGDEVGYYRQNIIYQSTMDLYFPNAGLTLDKIINSDDTYQALKDDPDALACSVEYSRYNHDSAVRTINSLPDTSAYLASAGGTNTIKFKGASGSATDGGAVSSLTAEEIAVATAKGWTVTLA